VWFAKLLKIKKNKTCHLTIRTSYQYLWTVYLRLAIRTNTCVEEQRFDSFSFKEVIQLIIINMCIIQYLSILSIKFSYI